MKKIVFSLSRGGKTVKTVRLGDFETKDRAVAAMLGHYRKAPKRGEFYYTIAEEEINAEGTIRSMTFSLCGGRGSFYQKYNRDMLAKMVL